MSSKNYMIYYSKNYMIESRENIISQLLSVYVRFKNSTKILVTY